MNGRSGAHTRTGFPPGNLSTSRATSRSPTAATEGGGQHGFEIAREVLSGQGAYMGMSDNPPTTLTVEQAAVVVGVGRSTAYEPVCSGDLKCIRLRRRIVVPVAHLAETLDVDRADVWSVISVDAPVTSSPARAAPSEQQPARRRAMATVETPTLF
ncbi:MAG: hypothetical protein DCC48_17165 [Acidobacteria bacterium]|nr:MAG: hypothetical protein DCC48_17165 [Acidobacteriota bacterium]